MKSPIDRAGIRLMMASAIMLVFSVGIWYPTSVLWVGPWLYADAKMFSMEWRRANVLVMWFNLAPFFTFMVYAACTMIPAMRRENAHWDIKKEEALAEYRHLPTVLEAEKKG